jgi:CDP-diacylglycerol--glycerol-3-phosphate 3-phosphatidyltransferase
MRDWRTPTGSGSGKLRDWNGYAERWAELHGGVDPRQAQPVVRRWLKATYRVGRVLARLRVPAGAVTLTGLVLNLLVPVLAGRHGGWPVLAALVVVLAGAADGLDGAVAVIRDRTTRLGYVYDSVADRIGEAAWLVALWLLGVPGWLAALCGALAWLHEYVRARAVGADMREIGVVTLAERPTRVIAATVGLFLGGIGGLITPGIGAGAAIVVTAVWTLLGALGLGQLANAVVAALHDAPADSAPGPGANTPAGGGPGGGDPDAETRKLAPDDPDATTVPDASRWPDHA